MSSTEAEHQAHGTHSVLSEDCPSTLDHRSTLDAVNKAVGPQRFGGPSLMWQRIFSPEKCIRCCLPGIASLCTRAQISFEFPDTF
jgi:hypothetical protein